MTKEHFPRKNWAGNYAYRAEKLHRPSTIEQVQEISANARGVHVLGSRHSFNDIADSSELITLEAMPMDVVVNHAANTVSFNAALKYGELVETLSAEGVALHNLASLPTSLLQAPWRRRHTARATQTATSRPRSRAFS